LAQLTRSLRSVDARCNIEILPTAVATGVADFSDGPQFAMFGQVLRTSADGRL